MQQLGNVSVGRLGAWAEEWGNPHLRHIVLLGQQDRSPPELLLCSQGQEKAEAVQSARHQGRRQLSHLPWDPSRSEILTSATRWSSSCKWQSSGSRLWCMRLYSGFFPTFATNSITSQKR